MANDVVVESYENTADDASKRPWIKQISSDKLISANNKEKKFSCQPVADHRDVIL